MLALLQAMRSTSSCMNSLHFSFFLFRFFLFIFPFLIFPFSYFLGFFFYRSFTGNKLTFYPKEGALKPGESETIMIGFESDVLGEFSEFFRFALQGNEHMLECNMKGHIIGPTFHFDSNLMDFGGVSYDYLHTRNIRLVNTSAIPIVFNLHVPQDGTHNKKEFDIIPPRGTLLSGTYHFLRTVFFVTRLPVYPVIRFSDCL